MKIKHFFVVDIFSALGHNFHRHTSFVQRYEINFFRKAINCTCHTFYKGLSRAASVRIKSRDVYSSQTTTESHSNSRVSQVVSDEEVPYHATMLLKCGAPSAG